MSRQKLYVDTIKVRLIFFCNFSNYGCPICGESMIDMQEYWAMIDQEIAATPMPEEYRDMLVQILCKDCHKVRPYILSRTWSGCCSVL